MSTPTLPPRSATHDLDIACGIMMAKHGTERRLRESLRQVYHAAPDDRTVSKALSCIKLAQDHDEVACRRCRGLASAPNFIGWAEFNLCTECSL